MNNGNQPAMCMPSEEMSDRHAEGIDLFTGLTKRELFAAMAMQGMLSTPDACDSDTTLATYSVAVADALLAALEQEKGDDRSD